MSNIYQETTKKRVMAELSDKNEIKAKTLSTRSSFILIKDTFIIKMFLKKHYLN